MPKTRSFLTPRRNSSLISFYHLDLEDLFISAASEERNCSQSRGLAAGCVSTSSSLYWIYSSNTQRTLELVIAENNSTIYFNALSGVNTTISSSSEKHFTPKNSRKPQNKVWIQNHPCLFLSVLNSQTNKKRTTNEWAWRRKRGQSDTRLRTFRLIRTTHHHH